MVAQFMYDGFYTFNPLFIESGAINKLSEAVKTIIFHTTFHRVSSINFPLIWRDNAFNPLFIEDETDDWLDFYRNVSFNPLFIEIL